MKSNTWYNLRLIIGREYLIRVKKKSFIVTTLLIPLLGAAVLGVTMYISMSSIGNERVAVIDDSGLYSDVLRDNEYYAFVPGTHTIQEYANADLLKSEGVTAVLHIERNLLKDPTGWHIYSYKKLPAGVISYINSSFSKYLSQEKIKEYDIPNLDQIVQDVNIKASVSSYQWKSTGESTRSSGSLAGVIGMVMAIIIMSFISNYAGQVMNGVLEEKKNRIMEILVSTVRPIDMMIGKMIGIFFVGLTQVAIWCLFACLIYVVGSVVIFGGVHDLSVLSSMNPTEISGMAAQMSSASMADMQYGLEVLGNINFLQLIVMLILYFIGGYVMYGALFAALGASVSSDEDAGIFVMPFMMIIMVAFYVAMGSMNNPDGNMAYWGSFIPLSSPFVMMVRIPYGGVSAWELSLSLGILYAFAFIISWLAARIYRVGILFTGKKPSLRDLWSWLFI